MTDREILLVVHPGRSETPIAARRISEIFGAAGISLRLFRAEQPSTGITDATVVDETSTSAQGCEIVLALGGDGTFLRAAALAHTAGDSGIGNQLGTHRLSHRGRGRASRDSSSNKWSGVTTASRSE